jgi:glycosyltransferase involved in cell wall biosynthesis
MLEGYRLALYLVAPEVLASAERLCSRYGLELDVLSRQRSDERPHEDLLAMHGRSRISIGLTTSDGISTSFLEALAMGSFPVQSNTGCAGDWALRGVSALFVRPDDQEELTAALRRALTDDKLIDQGVARNDRTVAVHLDRRVIAARLMDAYERIVASRPVSPPVGEPA